MPVIRKVTPRGKDTEEKAPEEVAVKAVPSGETVDEKSAALSERKTGGRKKVCRFCQSKAEPHYFDAAALRRYLSDRGRIYPRGRSGACAKHQRRISREIKRARHLSLLPFTVKAH
ncbi:MAG: 30S ribosomal protein S18 [bacterium]|nr:30S ribosomal protein S18 [bacterium]